MHTSNKINHPPFFEFNIRAELAQPTASNISFFTRTSPVLDLKEKEISPQSNCIFCLTKNMSNCFKIQKTKESNSPDPDYANLIAKAIAYTLIEPY
jgi:hypothetical protein